MRGALNNSSPIGIVGGDGQMGRWLRHFWQGLGYAVISSDIGTPLSNDDVMREAGIIFVAVPLRATPEVLRSLRAALAPTGALVSIASLMEPSATVLRDAPGETLCAHPVFGPTVTDIRGLPIVIAPVRGEQWCGWLAQAFREAGLSVRESTPHEHDASMAVVQALLHSLYVALCETMIGAGLPPIDALSWASPTLRLQLGLVARILGQDPELYADLVVGIALAPARLDELSDALRRLATLARNGDRGGFAAAFRQAREGFGESASELAERAERSLERFT